MKTLLLLLTGLLLAGCIKNPPTPPGPKPEWLLEKIIITDAFRDPNIGIIYSKKIIAYSYRNNKPSNCKYYSSDTNAQDTTNLIFMSRDSFFYDNQGRVRQVNSYGPNEPDIHRIVKHYYSGNNRLPAKIEFYPNINAGPSATHRYSYTDTSVTLIQPYYKGGFDTTVYFFDIRGNFYRQYSPHPSGAYGLKAYDNSPNPARFLHIENLLVFPLEIGSERLPRISQNNWTQITGLPNFDGSRIITTNEEGLVIKTVLPHNPGGHDYLNYITRYEYRHTN